MEQEDRRDDELAEIEMALRELAARTKKLDAPTAAYLIVMAADETRATRMADG